MMKYLLAILCMIVILGSSLVRCRSLCVRSQNTISPYEINSEGAKLARLVSKISTDVTTQFMLELVANHNGHSHFECHEEEFDSAVGEYDRCVRQVKHNLRCVGSGKELCGWLEAFTNTCSGVFLGNCLSSQARHSLKALQASLLSKNKVVQSHKCFDEDLQIDAVMDFARNLQHSEALINLISAHTFPSSTSLRLGRK